MSTNGEHTNLFHRVKASVQSHNSLEKPPTPKRLLSYMTMSSVLPRRLLCTKGLVCWQGTAAASRSFLSTFASCRPSPQQIYLDDDGILDEMELMVGHDDLVQFDYSSPTINKNSGTTTKSKMSLETVGLRQQQGTTSSCRTTTTRRNLKSMTRAIMN